MILPLRLVDADLAMDDNLLAIAKLDRLSRRIAAKQHGAQLRAGILQRKINVPARLRAQV